ncbi:hypothetical protein I302_103132 [Kwoniella bestiolae CBS 10118]|uniref:Metallo-beta-lactamase domain-containing protein n=1 Tax=Kwoniella bestiolae CBS 10118 TaxID=1296100 RepID=A0A1B9GH02_9TREE|nr:hypothetical protein I302_01832 [Kwoniella bestiolae CBS 10118]OCF30313.1 hypothetical protein I302_01832 [Kwoniella bestiolae CBS 10118]
MIDCGPSATWKLSKAGLNPKDVNTLYLTHHHFDHNVDTPCFLLTRWDQNALSGKPVEVRGPQPTERFCEGIIGMAGVFQPDWNARINWGPSLDVYQARGGQLPRQPPQVSAKNITPGWSHSTSEYKITAGYADHAQPYLDCLCYRIDFPNAKSAVFSGDTGVCDEVVELAKGADMFFCMSSGADMNDRVALGQCTPGAAEPKDAGLMAERAGVKTLILVHQGPGQAKKENWYKSIDGAKEAFSGEVIFGEEITSFEL